MLEDGVHYHRAFGRRPRRGGAGHSPTLPHRSARLDDRGQHDARAVRELPPSTLTALAPVLDLNPPRGLGAPKPPSSCSFGPAAHRRPNRPGRRWLSRVRRRDGKPWPRKPPGPYQRRKLEPAAPRDRWWRRDALIAVDECLRAGELDLHTASAIRAVLSFSDDRGSIIWAGQEAGATSACRPNAMLLVRKVARSLIRLQHPEGCGHKPAVGQNDRSPFEQFSADAASPCELPHVERQHFADPLVGVRIAAGGSHDEGHGRAALAGDEDIRNAHIVTQQPFPHPLALDDGERVGPPCRQPSRGCDPQERWSQTASRRPRTSPRPRRPTLSTVVESPAARKAATYWSQVNKVISWCSTRCCTSSPERATR